MTYSLLAGLSLLLERLSGHALVWAFLVFAVVVVMVLVRTTDRIGRLERELKRLRQDAAGGSAGSVEPPPSTAPPSAPPSEVGLGAAGVAIPVAEQGPTAPHATVNTPWRAPPPRPAAVPRASTRMPFAEEEAQPPGRLARVLGAGNWLVRGGVLLLFLGVGFLLKFAVDNVLLPAELRLGAVALGGGVMLVLGLRLIRRRRSYALALQGGGVGLLYLTLYAAFRLYGLLPAAPAVALMVVLVAGAGWLAWRQDALPLAVLGALGGFAAPVLASTGSGSHVLLFSYYAVLNAGVLGLALVRSWRMLNLVGFLSTFVVSAVWGHRFYEPRHFASVEPFLILFFIMYVMVAVLFARGRSVRLQDPMDATLVFGTPLAAFGLQSRMSADSEHTLAWTALVLAAFYTGLAVVAWSRDRLRMLAEAFAALAVGFAIILVPLALDARWTSASWALEGAALLWVGWRQRRTLARAVGAALQLLAGAAWWWWHGSGQMVWETADWLGSVLLAVAGLASSALLARGAPARAPDGLRDRRGGDERSLGIILGVWGLLWWYAGGVAHLTQTLQLRGNAWVIGAVLLLLAGSAVALEVAGRGLCWRLGRVAAALLPMALLPWAALEAVHETHPLLALAALGWPVAFASAAWVLHRQDGESGSLQGAGHALSLWLVCALAAWELAWWFQGQLPEVESWQQLAWLLAPAAILVIVSRCAPHARPWPFTTRASLYLTAGSGPVVCFIGGGILALSLGDPSGPWPVPYLPVLNPLDLGLAAAIGACAYWGIRSRALLAPALRNLLALAGAGLGFLWLNGVLLRGFHFWAGIEYRFQPMFGSTLVQAGLSLLWATTALLTMVAASRTSMRASWSLGAALMVTVVVKLMLVDLASTATIARIVTFISVGLLLMVVGYLAPVPPRSGDAAVTGEASSS